MIIRQLTLNDYGPYGGEHTFELDTSPGKPVILVGGRNGGGKTTWFESIPLCLYGHQSGRSGRKSYEERLRRLIHRSGNGRMEISERRTSIRVKFQISSGGKLAEYMVRRSWRASKDGVSEELDVKRKTANEYVTLDSVEQDQWQSFVTGLIPPGIADLFFFDGEKVAQMAEGGRENSAIRTAFNSLLGLDTVERLRTDLRTNLVRNLSGDDTHIREEVERLETEKAEIEQTATRTKDTRTRKISELGRVRSHIQAIEDKLESLGGGYAKKRQDIRERLASKEAVAGILTRRIGVLCAAELPFGMMPLQLAEVKGQMKADAAAARRAAEARVIDEALLGIRKVATAHAIPSDTSDAIMDTIRALAPPPGDAAEVFGFSTLQREKLYGIMERSMGSAPDEAGEASEQYDSTSREISQLRTMLDSAPADDEIGPMVSEVASLHNEAGRLEAEVEHLDMEAAKQETLIRHTNARIRDKVNSRYKNEKSQRMAGLTRAVDGVLDEYARRLRTKKIGLLERYVGEAAQTLLHKRNFIDHISIDPETFEAAMYDADNNEIPRDTLSQGELQMMATSVLWGLARTSGRPLPFMIDTPLARLDAEHRSNLTERFFPLASHQILLFSTDTEIRVDDYAKLRRYVSRSYTIQYDPDSAGTKVRHGYFWDENEV